MKIVKAYAPNFAQLKRAFNITRGHGTVCAFGDRIYAPEGTELPPSVYEHEIAHCRRQTCYDRAFDDVDLVGSVAAWWHRYIVDVAFRLEEEIIGHRAEYSALMNVRPMWRDRHVQIVAKKLASPLYGGIITYDEAVKAITGG